MKRMLLVLAVGTIVAAGAARVAGQEPAGGSGGLAVQRILLDRSVKVGELTLFPSLDDEKTFYYLPDKVRLATDANGRPKFSFLRWVENQRSAPDARENREGIGGGIVHAVVTLGVTEEQLQKARAEVQRVVPGAKIAGAAMFSSGTMALVSAFDGKTAAEGAAGGAGETPRLTHRVVGIANAPLLDGQQAAVSIHLTKFGSQVLWESFKTPAPDISFYFDMKVDGYHSPFSAVLEADWDKVYQHQAFGAGIASTYFGGEIQMAFEDLRKSGAIRLRQVGNDTQWESKLQETYKTLTELMFDKVDPNQAMAAAAQGADGQEGLFKSASALRDHSVKAADDRNTKARAENVAIRAKNEMIRAANLKRMADNEKFMKLQAARTKTEQAKKEHEAAAARMAALEKKATDADGSAKELKGQADEAGGQVKAADAKVADAMKAAADAKAAVQTAQQKVKDLEKQIADAAKENKPTDDLKTALEAAVQGVKDAEKNAAEAAKTLDAAKKESAAAKAAQKDLEMKAAAAAKAVETAKSDSATAKAAADRREKEKAAAEAEQAKFSDAPEALQPLEKEVPEVKEESLPSFAIFATYKMKRQRQSGTFRIDLNKFSTASRAMPFAENIGDLRRLTQNTAHFRQVNLDDPLYKQREIVASVDGVNAQDFGQFVNFVTVQMRKKHAKGDVTDDEIRIDRNNFSAAGNNFKLLYGWKDDTDRRKWLEYEFRTVWSFFGGRQVEVPWQKTENGAIALAPPFQRRPIEVHADPDLVKEHGLRALTVKLFYDLGSGEQVRQFTLNAFKDPPVLSGVVEIMLPTNQPDYGYEAVYQLKGNRTVSSGRQKTSSGALIFDELPRQ